MRKLFLLVFFMFTAVPCLRASDSCSAGSNRRGTCGGGILMLLLGLLPVFKPEAVVLS